MLPCRQISWGSSLSQSVDMALLWHHNGRGSASNHQPHDCLLNRLFGRRSKKTSKLRVTGLCVGNSPGPVNSPHKWPVTRKMFIFDDVIMVLTHQSISRLWAVGSFHLWGLTDGWLWDHLPASPWSVLPFLVLDLITPCVLRWGYVTF